MITWLDYIVMALSLIPCCPEITTPLLVGDIFFKIDERSIIFFMERCQMFLLRCSKWIQDHSGCFRTPRLNFNFCFAFQKQRFFSGIRLVKILILHRFFIDFYQYSILCLPPFCFNSSFHFGIWSISFASLRSSLFQTCFNTFSTCP